MAWSSADITGNEKDSFDLDKPMLVARHHARDATISTRWNTTGNASGADSALAGFPGRRAYDGFSHLLTQPDSAQNTWYYVSTITGTNNDVDCVIIHGNNLSTADTITMEIADDATFATNKVTLATWTPSDDNRLFNFELDDTGGGGMKRYSTIPFWRLKLTKSSSWTPGVNEIWLGRRRQLRFFPDIPFDNLHENARVSSFVTRSGIKTDYVQSDGQSVRELHITQSLASSINRLSNWWKECGRGTKSFYWVETPSGDPRPYLMTVEGAPKDFNQLLVGPTERSLPLSFMEQAPFYNSEFSV